MGSVLVQRRATPVRRSPFVFFVPLAGFEPSTQLLRHRRLNPGEQRQGKTTTRGVSERWRGAKKPPGVGLYHIRPADSRYSEETPPCLN